MGDSMMESIWKSKILDNLRSGDYLSVWRGYGTVGIVGTIFIGILIAFLLPSIFLVKKRWKRRGVSTEVGGEPGYAVRNARVTELSQVPWKEATTMAALFEQSCRKHSQNKFLGTRKLISKEFVTSSDGRKFEKLHLGEYEWQTYGEVFDCACNFASGIVRFGHDVDTRAAIYAETCAEWFIAFQGCFRQNITVVTIYASLGEEALIHSLNETEVSTLICNSKQLRKLMAIGSSLTTIQNIIYFEDSGYETDFISSENMSKWKVASFSEVIKLGTKNPVVPSLPSSHSIAVVMYTSGSTGLPKGVMISHGNIVATAAGVTTVIPRLGIDDVYLAYLPLAHVLELAAETVILSAGLAMGYGSSLTMTDTSNKIKEGTKGDISVLKPTIMTAVPAILDRVRDGVLKKVEERGGLVKKLFHIGYNRQLAALEGRWFGAWGLERLFWNVLIFKKIRSVLGGRIRFMLCGGAPLSGEAQRFFNICMGATIGQGYGLTETFAGAAFSEWDDTSVGRVGPPLPCCFIKLVSWEEGGYRTTDKPMPRGEIVIGGTSVTVGYFKNPEKTNEVYKDDEKGMRWFYTGDIGTFHPDGCLEIIDRKKDIVKLQHGEYISLGKAEATLLSSKYVDNVMVYADPFHNYCVALVVPLRPALEKWAKEAGINYGDFSQLCENGETISEVQRSLFKVAKDAKLQKFEIPEKIKLVADPWTPESGLVTAALKIKREQVKAKFKNELEQLYNKYLCKKGVWIPNPNSLSKGPWKSIFKACCTADKWYKIVVGKGDKIRFWEDIWLGDEALKLSFPRIFNVIIAKGNLVRQCWSESLNSWVLPLRRNLTDEESIEWANLHSLLEPIRLNNREDTKRWSLRSDGCFSVKSLTPVLLDANGPIHSELFKIFWTAKVPRKVKIFLWILLQGKLNTIDVVQRKWKSNSLSPNWCVMCRRNGEDQFHLFFSCSFATSVWEKILLLFGLSWCFPNRVDDAVVQLFLGTPFKNQAGILWLNAIMASLWKLWHERNQRVFNEKECSLNELWDSIRLFATIWCSTCNSFCNYDLVHIMANWASFL